jgi:hypothetical protein
MDVVLKFISAWGLPEYASFYRFSHGHLKTGDLADHNL